MSAIPEAPADNHSSAQATELCLLVDLEARWENLRMHQRSATSKAASNRDELHQIQKAHEVFFAKLVAYNKKYKPVHVPEQLLNNARRLGVWCDNMRNLHLRVQHDSKAHFPVHLMEKAYLRADRLADRIKRDRITRPVRLESIKAAINELEDMVQWCASLAPANPR
jgi:hypothetical protein